MTTLSKYKKCFKVYKINSNEYSFVRYGDNLIDYGTTLSEHTALIICRTILYDWLRERCSSLNLIKQMDGTELIVMEILGRDINERHKSIIGKDIHDALIKAADYVYTI